MHKSRKSLYLAGVFVAGIGLCAVAAQAQTDLSRQAIAANDGWAAGTDGGAAASDAHVYTVTNRAELVAALQAGGNPDVAKIIKVQGTINLSVDNANKELLEKDYADPAYDFEAYKAAYAPAVWNVRLTDKKRPERDLTGPLEEARKRSAER